MTIKPLFRLNDEAGRLAALRRYEILDSAPETEFSDIVALVKSIFNTKYAAINLIDSERQWMKAAAGLEPLECGRGDAFCDHTIRGTSALAVEDATADSRFSDNPFVTGEASIRSYLGVPLTSPDGYNIGAICVFDTGLRKFSDADKTVLENFAKVVMSQFELRLIARQDSLTGSLTRRAFVERMDRLSGREDPVSLLMIDLDRFKLVNDTFGHPVGDIVLKSVATTIQSSLRKSDALGRLGGEEFAVLLPGADATGALAFADRLRNEIATRKLDEIAGANVTLSIGIADHRAGESRDLWLARADHALYAAKTTGRNRCVVAE
ncbi:sensor domain-containing diguanylate cyclase [Rhodobacter sp. 24-YEA-8]|uniref:sensor domain-containing diguanylate cyclase n=1 Tax=Rhodobacter sp. 24-YEA-8 TaxID=1884310 RepID=UPI000898C68F|nr:sensor domain-containing diguanylate cyclase [Rhodobacter sp. 24-YEA-8]SEC61773.1 diguanylate cyclase with GAF sensor [Rhodobacter sp. 24-YEA-8]